MKNQEQWPSAFWQRLREDVEAAERGISGEGTFGETMRRRREGRLSPHAVSELVKWKREAEEAALRCNVVEYLASHFPQQKRAAIVEWLEGHKDKTLRDISDLNGRMEGEIAALKAEREEVARLREAIAAAPHHGATPTLPGCASLYRPVPCDCWKAAALATPRPGDRP